MLDRALVSMVVVHADTKDFYTRALAWIALAQNDAKQLKVGAEKGNNFAKQCLEHLGSHPSLLTMTY